MVLFAPVDAAVGDVGVDGGPDGGMEAVGSELLEKPVASESVFDRVFDLGEMELDLVDAAESHAERRDGGSLKSPPDRGRTR